ncbi:serpin family protein [Singulisphaera sp. Ch08]|uniref:Serpin family protein n=1 Tax=Singulisphaera sp. Ch08 TaxID=3120278 RepID=A0AAU7CIL9_9BACT
MSRNRIVTLFAMIMLAAPAGCGTSATPRRAERPRMKVTPVALPLHRPDRADRTALPGVVQANNAFALDLYHRLRSEPGNLLISPACLTAGLGLLRAGARGETAAEFDRVLHRTVTLPDRALAALIQDLDADGEDRAFQIRLANAVWVPRNYALLDDYRAALRNVFAIHDDRQVDFDGHPAEAARIINAWISERTGGKITGVIPPQSVTTPTKLVLTSALYFRGSWTEGFYRPETRDEPFHVTRTRSVTVPMMHQHSYTKVHDYLDGGSFLVVSLSCGQGAFAMDVLLPKEVDGLGALEATLTPEMLAALWPKLKRSDDIDISLPRFRAQSSRALEPVLKELGLSRAFVRERADFSGINGKPADLYATAVTHETFVDVNEEGIEAAAFTRVISPDAFGIDPPPVIRADHPFLYLLRDTRSGCIVFLGRVVEPGHQ